MHWMIYGANGHTGRAIAREAAVRGMRPTLAGRNGPQIEALADELDCPSRVFALNENPSQLAGQLEAVDTLLHCAGPFSQTAEPMIDTCLQVGVNYLDITGEIDVIETAAARDDRARQAGVCLIPAVGFDVVATDCLAATLARRMPEAIRLQLAFTMPRRVSTGTARTVLEGLADGGRVRIDGQITKVPHAYRTMRVPFRDGPRRAVTIPWGDVSSAYHTTGIGNIEVYAALPNSQILGLRLGRHVLRLRPVRALFGGLLRRSLGAAAPDPDEPLVASIWGRVCDTEGNTSEATLQTPDGYRFTVASALASIERILAGDVGCGFSTPASAFGPEFVLKLPGTDLQ